MSIAYYRKNKKGYKDEDKDDDDEDEQVEAIGKSAEQREYDKEGDEDDEMEAKKKDHKGKVMSEAKMKLHKKLSMHKMK